MAGVNPSLGFWRGRKVWLSGHTGFKGGWLALWLQQMGAQVHGFALAPATEPALFDLAEIGSRIAGHTVGDLRDAAAVEASMSAASPEIVFHLAAQPLVRASYQEPARTYATNVVGTAHVLDAVRRSSTVRAVVCVTTDKCYENREWLWPYRETDRLGGRDPYSSSKACAELVTDAYRQSFLAPAGIAAATARAGNVIGGGDWSADRLLPDYLRAARAGRELEVRSPNAVRPWQHVLEPLAGYLLLAERLHGEGQAFAEGFNFGPADTDCRPVCEVLDYAVRHGGGNWRFVGDGGPHEAGLLKLDSAKARNRLGWEPRWCLDEAVGATVQWEREWRAGRAASELCAAQIAAYEAAA